MNIIIVTFFLILLACYISCVTLPGARKGFRTVLVTAVLLLCVNVPASGADMEQGRVKETVTNNYRLKKEAPAGTEMTTPEGIGPEEFFPLYGSREERIFKPWLEVFSYREGRGFRLNVDFERDGQERK